MPPGIGYSYAPGSDIPFNGERGGQAPSRLSPQQAVKILSLRVPEALPSNAPVARQLLTSPGGSAAGASGLQSMIQQLIQGFQPGGGMAPLPSRQMPFPPTQAPMTGPNQNVSQQPQFVGNIDSPMQNPFWGPPGPGMFAGAGNDISGAMQFFNQASQSSPLAPSIIWGNDQTGPFGVSGVQNA